MAQKITKERIDLGADGVYAEISQHQKKDGLFNVYAQLFDQDSHQPLLKTPPKKRNVTEEEVPLAKESVLAAVRGKIPKKEIRVEVDHDHPYSDLWAAMTEAEKIDCLPDTILAPSTQKRALGEFKTMIKFLDKYGLDIAPEHYEEIETWRRDKATGSKRAKGAADATTHGAYARAMQEFNRIYANFRNLVRTKFGIDLPKIKLTEVASKESHHHEQLRAFTDEVAVRVYYLLARLSLVSGLALGAVGMLMGLFRTAEAVAIRFGDVVDKGWYGVCGVLERGNADGTRLARLKNTNSKRLIVLQREYMVLYHAVYAHLQKTCPAADINQRFVCATDVDHKVMVTPQEFSRYMRRILVACGCDGRYWEMVSAAMQEAPDCDREGNVVKEPSAYANRHAGATRLINNCGMDPLKVDADMGHALPEGSKDWYAELRAVDNWPVLAAKKSRFVFDDLSTSNPAFSPLRLSSDMDQTVVGQMVVRMVAETDDVVVEITADSEELGDALVLTLPEGAVVEHIEAHPGSEFPANEILYPLHDRAWYQAQRDYVDKIDLTQFIAWPKEEKPKKK